MLLAPEVKETCALSVDIKSIKNVLEKNILVCKLLKTY